MAADSLIPSWFGMTLILVLAYGIGGSLLYFVDRYGDQGTIWDVDFRWTGEREARPCGTCTSRTPYLRL